MIFITKGESKDGFLGYEGRKAAFSHCDLFIFCGLGNQGGMVIISFIMACSKYQYVKKFQESTTALLQTYILVRVDGRGFTKFCAAHEFKKPNDLRAIKLMNAAAEFVCNSFSQIFLAYGQSDEYSFVFNKNTTLFSRRTDKILSCLVSAFTSAYVFNWTKFFEIQLREIPTFDSRVVVYPNQNCLKDYFRWRQVDCHINNLYNTIFWAMVGSGKSNQQVEKYLKDTNSAAKNELLFTQYHINYNNIEQIYRRGTLFYYVAQKEEFVKEEDNLKIEKEVVKGMEELAVQQKEIEKDNNEEKAVLKTQQKTASKEQKLKLKQRKQQKSEKVRRKLIMSHEDCIKQQFWSKFFN